VVIHFAEVRQDEVGQAGVHNLGDDADRLDIGKVSLVTEDALFEMPVVGTVAQHFLVVIAFQNYGGTAF